MGLLKARYMGDAMKVCCTSIFDMLDPQHIFVLEDNFADGSTRKYNEQIQKDTADAHWNKVRAFLNEQKQNSPAAAEAEQLLTCLWNLEQLRGNAGLLKDSAKTDGAYDPDDDRIVKECSEFTENLAHFSTLLSEFNRKTDFKHFSKTEMTSLMQISEKIDDVILTYQSGCTSCRTARSIPTMFPTY